MPDPAQRRARLLDLLPRVYAAQPRGSAVGTLLDVMAQRLADFDQDLQRVLHDRWVALACGVPDALDGEGDDAALDRLGALLQIARLPARIREKEGLSYSTYTWFSADSLDDAAGFWVSSIFAPQNKERVERAVREELERAVREGFDAGEVEAAKKGLLEARRLARTQDPALAARLARYLHLGRTFAWDVALEARIASLTPAEVQAALGRHLALERLAVAKAGDFR